jgi:hypothetical protein
LPAVFFGGFVHFIVAFFPPVHGVAFFSVGVAFDVSW